MTIDLQRVTNKFTVWNFRANKKRQFKNKKFGFGGQKKRSKHNTAESSAGMGGYSVKKHGSVPSKYQNKNKKSVSGLEKSFIDPKTCI